jgi:copper transport protein
MVTVVFDQPVRPDDGGLIVLDSSGTKVSMHPGHPEPDTIDAQLPGDLGSGAFVANYTVTSVDGHVVSGGIVFLVGNASANSVGQLTRRTPSLPKALDDTGQFLTYLGVLTAGGLAFFLAFILVAGEERRFLRRLLFGAMAIGVVGMVATVIAQAALTGGSWEAIRTWSVVSQAIDGKFGAQSAVQILGLGVCVWSLRLQTTMSRQFAAFYGLLASSAAFVLFGHALASADRWVTVPADVVHVTFASIWIGGLTGVVVVLWSRFRRRKVEQIPDQAFLATSAATTASLTSRVGTSGTSGTSATSTALLEREASNSDLGGTDDRGLLKATADMVGRFSTMAGISVMVLLVAGTVLAIALVGSLHNLIDTAYGHLLLIKIGAVGLLIFVAAYNRLILLPFLFDKTRPATDDSDVRWGWSRLRATVRAEAIGVIAVLVVTSLLVNGTPSNTSTVVLTPVPFHQTQQFENGHVTLDITPNQALVNNFVVQFTGPGGAPRDLAESVSVYLVLPSENVGPIETDMKHAGVGQFELADSPYPPIVGQWQVVLQVQVSEFSQPDVSFVDNVK